MLGNTRISKIVFLILAAVSSAGFVGCQLPKVNVVHQTDPSKAESAAARSSESDKSEIAKSKLSVVKNQNSPPMQWSSSEIKGFCKKRLSQLPGRVDKNAIEKICSQAKVLAGCQSGDSQEPIFYYDRPARDPQEGKKILTLSLIHGDEIPSGSVARSWMERLSNLDPRNHWRVIPVVNPDGLDAKTRTNGRGVDLNRNFPTADWNHLALERWRKVKKSDPRRFPGEKPASEIETQCLMSHFKDFNPDFIISIHTPLGVLDFDGPKELSFPQFSPLPWISLGHMPGSLGRYMWRDHNVPVLTIELTGSGGVNKLEQFDRLQDISGTVAIQAAQTVKKRRQVKTAKGNDDNE